MQPEAADNVHGKDRKLAMESSNACVTRSGSACCGVTHVQFDERYKWQRRVQRALADFRGALALVRRGIGVRVCCRRGVCHGLRRAALVAAIARRLGVASKAAHVGGPTSGHRRTVACREQVPPKVFDVRRVEPHLRCQVAAGNRQVPNRRRGLAIGWGLERVNVTNLWSKDDEEGQGKEHATAHANRWLVAQKMSRRQTEACTAHQAVGVTLDEWADLG
eukprot:365533-Chlamydomonas_euryale.AAC.10